MNAKRALPSFRLVDGVIIAAVALLGLKVLGLFADRPAPPAAVPAAAPAPEPRPGGTAKDARFGRLFAHARTNYDPDEPATTGSVAQKPAEGPAVSKDEPSAPREPAPPLQPPSASERILLERLGERREELQQRSREMEARERMIQEQERKLEERLGQLKASEETQKTVAATKTAADPSALKNVVIMYETMKPKEAARVFDRLPLEVLLSVVTQMNSRKMAEILAVMTPENAEKLTVALARRANAMDDAKPMGTSAAALPPGELPAIERPGLPRR